MSFSFRGVIVLFSCAIWIGTVVGSNDTAVQRCINSDRGTRLLYSNRMGRDRILICVKDDNVFRWEFLDGSSTYGESFNPAKDCSDIVDKIPKADDGFYWVSLYKRKPQKVWCDVHTDGGGFMLVGMKDHPKSWTVPSNSKPVHPKGPPHWSSAFGNVKVQDFAVQVSTRKSFDGTQAHWLYRLKPKRELGNLFSVDKQGCTSIQPGIGNITFVKDIRTGNVVTRNFSCSKFGPHTHPNLGWGRMNYCLRHECKKGYAILPGPLSILYDQFGSFSYSAVSSSSGIGKSSTAFVGCDHGKCCACFGPKGGRNDYCGPKCTAINGGKVIQKAFVWFWVRTSMPKRVWKRCMEFKKKNAVGKIETYFIYSRTGTPRKGSCSRHFKTFLNEGTLTVADNESLQKIPPVPGLLSYRVDSKQLYVNEGSKWDALGKEKEVLQLKERVKNLEIMLKGAYDYPECSSYTWLKDANRNEKYISSTVLCDKSLSTKWYRFGGQAGKRMPTSCVPKRRCGTYATGWMNGTHPTVSDGKVVRNVCYHVASRCCYLSNNIEVLNCGYFYIYKLGPPSFGNCSLRYCGSDN